MPVLRSVLTAAASAALLVLAGCGGGSAGTDDGSAAAAEPSSAASPGPGGAEQDRRGGDRGEGQQNEEQQNGGQQGEGQEGEGQQEPDEVAVPEALAFTATQVSGETFDAAELAGSGTVFWFWAPWCTECAAAAADVQAAASATSDVTFVGVAGLSSDVDAMQGFVTDHGLTFTQLSDTDGSLYTRFGVTQQDTYVVVSADGSVETVPAYGDSVDLDALVADAAG